jgi:hypothetical protein
LVDRHLILGPCVGLRFGCERRPVPHERSDLFGSIDRLRGLDDGLDRQRFGGAHRVCGFGVPGDGDPVWRPGEREVGRAVVR